MTDPILSVQIVNIDYYMLRAKNQIGFIEVHDSAVPVIRVFGSTEAGQRSCIHIHGVRSNRPSKGLVHYANSFICRIQVFPYLYFRPANVLDDSFDSIDQLNT